MVAEVEMDVAIGVWDKLSDLRCGVCRSARLFVTYLMASVSADTGPHGW